MTIRIPIIRIGGHAYALRITLAHVDPIIAATGLDLLDSGPLSPSTEQCWSIAWALVRSQVNRPEQEILDTLNPADLLAVEQSVRQAINQFFPTPGSNAKKSDDEQDEQDEEQNKEQADDNHPSIRESIEELLGFVGCERSEVSLRELLWRSNGRMSREWQHSSLIACLIHNANCSKKSQLKKPQDFNLFLLNKNETSKTQQDLVSKMNTIVSLLPGRPAWSDQKINKGMSHGQQSII